MQNYRPTRVDYKTFNLECFCFKDEVQASWKDRFIEIVNKLARPRVALQSSPVKRKEGTARVRDSLLEELAESLSLYKPVLSFHQRRLLFRRDVRQIVYQVSGLVLVFVVFAGLYGLIKIVKPLIISTELEGMLWSRAIEGAIILTFQLLFTFVIVRVAFRLGSVLTNKNFAESLCVMVVVFIIVDLSRDDILTDPKKKKRLLIRLDDLARVTRLLAFRYASRNERNQQWINSHFSRLQQFILERARWAVAPMDCTLDDLRQDFYELAKMYVEGNYGAFSWGTQDDLTERSLTWKTRVFAILPPFVGIVVPLILMVPLLRKPAYLESVGISSNIMALILIAWLLLAVDGALKLGVVAGIANLAKEIKSLK